MTVPRCPRCQEPLAPAAALADRTSMQHSDPAQCIEALRVRIIEAETANTALRIELRAAREEAEELVKQNERLRETLVGLEFQRHPRSRLRPLRPEDGNEGGDGLTDPPPASS